MSDGLTTLLKETAHRGPDQVAMAHLDDHQVAPDVHALDDEDLDGRWAMGHARLAITGDQGTQPMRDCGHRFAVAINGELWNHEQLRERLEHDHDMAQDSDCDVLPHLIEEHLHTGADGLVEAVERTTAELDGEYAFAVMDEDRIVLVRDPMGIKPLYHGRGRGRVAFASERKALWALGLDTERVPPNSVVVLDEQGVDVREQAPVAAAGPERFTDANRALDHYDAALEHAIAKRVRGVDRVAVVFSGGVDSALVAAGAKRLGADVTCFVAGSEGSPDVDAAREAAELMDLELRVVEISPALIGEWLVPLMRAVEERNQLHVETAVPLFAVSRAAADEGFRVLLTGQGADELFGGYRWYPTVLDRDGAQALRARMREDRDLLYKECLEREDKVAMAHGLELRVPFLDLDVVEAAERIPVDMLIDGPDDGMGKRLHRVLAARWGVPDAIAWREKDAAQHGSGTRDALIAAADALVDGPVPDDYDPAKSVPERMGSSQRYGHEYSENAGAWDLHAPLQWALDHIALENGTVPPSDAVRLVEHEILEPATNR